MSRNIFWGDAGVTCVYANDVVMAEVQVAISELNSDDRMKTAQFVIHDFRASSSLEEGISAMLALTGHLYGKVPYNTTVRTAVLVSGLDDIARFNGLSASSKRPMRAFDSLESAQTWIQGAAAS